MNANELRYGNYIQRITPDSKEYIQVEKISKHFINGLGVSAYLPIPLIEEWLLKFGFEFYKPLSHYRLVYNDVWYQINHKDGVFMFSFVNLNYFESNYMPPKQIEYVHKLQNLFYELENKELWNITTQLKLV